jgi:hypothetical protein
VRDDIEITQCEVGYSEAGRLPSEVRLTAFIADVPGLVVTATMRPIDERWLLTELNVASDVMY